MTDKDSKEHLWPNLVRSVINFTHHKPQKRRRKVGREAFLEAVKEEKVGRVSYTHAVEPAAKRFGISRTAAFKKLLPKDLITRYGLGKTAYREAIRIDSPGDARALSNAYLSVSTSLDEHRITLIQAQTRVRLARLGLASDWSSWKRAVELRLSKAWEHHGTSILVLRNCFYEIGKALEIAARE